MATFPARWLSLLPLPLLLSGCLTAAYTAYDTATDERSVVQQARDVRIASEIRTRILDVDSAGLLAVDVFCHEGRVVIAGVLPPASPLRRQVVTLARAVEGVRRVETYYVTAQPSKGRDFVIRMKVKLKIITDLGLRAAQVNLSVVGGHVVLVGVVDRQEKIARVVHHARAVEGVTAVRSFIQIRPPAP